MSTINWGTVFYLHAQVLNESALITPKVISGAGVGVSQWDRAHTWPDFNAFMVSRNKRSNPCPYKAQQCR